jgi:hypothetical protein
LVRKKALLKWSWLPAAALAATGLSVVVVTNSAAGATSLCPSPKVGAAEEVLSNTARHAAGLDMWPDHAVTPLRQPDGSYRFYMAAASGGIGVRPQRNVITQGTLDNPLRDGVVSSSQIVGVPSKYTWAGGGPVYVDPSGIALQLLHMEVTYPGQPNFYSELHLGAIDLKTGITTYLGPVLQPDVDYATAQEKNWTMDVGLPGFTIVHDGGTAYFQLYFPEFAMSKGQLASTGLSVARAKISDVVAAARQGRTTKWWKRGPDGKWDSPAWGGSSADLQPGSPMAWQPQVVHSKALGGYVMVAATSLTDMVLSTSKDGVRDWSPRVSILHDKNVADAYTTVIGTGSDPRELGRSFYLYYLQWNSPNPDWNAGARVLRRKVTCGVASQPTATPTATAPTSGTPSSPVVTTSVSPTSPPSRPSGRPTGIPTAPSPLPIQTHLPVTN